MAEKHRIKHDLDHDLARKVTRRALETYRDSFPELKPGGEWLDADRARLWFTAPGAKLEGRVKVLSDAIELELDVPFLFRPFRKQAIKVIEEEVQEWIEKAKAGELDD
jgi:hypothetical protein